MDAATLKSRFAEFNLDPALAEAVEAAPASQILEGILRLEDPHQIPPQFTLVSQFIRICTGRFLAADAWAIRLHPNVVSLKAARSMGIHDCCKNLPESMHESGETEEIVPRTNRTLPFTGRGCMVAALDFGLDFAHPNFVNPDGTTRVTAFWNQGAAYDASHPNRYGYGRIFSQDEIDAALRVSDPYQALGYHPSISDTGHGSHGTHTLDIAAGNGRARGSTIGVAPDADLLFVHLSTPNLGSGDLGDSVRMLEGLDFVHRTAQDRPWVVNLSVGRTAGSHDGTSPFEQGMHELLRLGAGRAIVQSAGNYRAADLAVEGWLRDGESRDLEWIIDPRDTTSNEIDAWYSGNDRFTVALRPPEGGEFVEVRLGEVADVEDHIEHNGSLAGRIYHRKNDPNNRDNHIQVFLYPHAPSGVWTLRLTGEYVINGRFHAWIERAQATPGAQSRFNRNITSQSYTLGTIATSPLVITVGAYDAHAEGGPLAPFSSCGPTRDERHDKPELLAPGVSVLAARSIPRGAVQQEGLLIPRSGTSMAAPHVAGCVAAMFEAAGRPVSIQEIRDGLKGSAEPVADDERPGCCAWGRVNIAEAIGRMRDLNWPEFITTPQTYSSTSDRWLGTAGPPASDAIAEDIEGLISEDIEDLSEEHEIQAPLDKGLPMTFDTDRFLDRAEQALGNNNAGRLQSETSFLQHLMRELGGRVSTPGLSPASLFRAAVKDSSLQSVQDRLTIVALPSEQPETPLRAGDWMVRVVSGTGDVGHISILASADLVPPAALAYEGIAAEGMQPGYYGIVVESGAFPHSRQESFARRFLDARGRVPAHTVILRPQPDEPDASEDYKPPAWLKIERRKPRREREPYLDFDAADFTTASEGEDRHTLQETYDPATVPKTVADALGNKDWPRALALAIQAGWHDENDLTDLLFFTRHPELTVGPLDQKQANYKKLSAEWSVILDREARPAIETASEDTTLKVSGQYVAERDRQFWGKTGKKFRELVEWAAKEVDINPGLLGAVLLAEWDQSSLYLSSDSVISFQSGSDDFFEARAQLAANVPAFSKVHFDITRKFTNTNEHGRIVTTIPFNSGKDAALATAVYLKYAEVKLRKGAAKNGGDFDKLPAETRFALVRIAMAAGHGGIDTDGTLIRFKQTDDKKWVPVGKGGTGGILVGVASYLETVLARKDILIRKNEPRGDPSSSGHITARNATILTAQALHLSDWIFTQPQAAPAAATPSGVKESEGWSDPQEADSDKFTPPSWLKIERRTRTRSGPAEDIDSEAFTFDPTAEQTDFGPKLREAWHNAIKAAFDLNIASVTTTIAGSLKIDESDAAKHVRFFSLASDTPSFTLTGTNVNWRALPRSFVQPTKRELYQFLDDLHDPDDPYNPHPKKLLRIQDEYCEWQVFRTDKKIVRVVFTSEPPEYYSFLYDPGVSSLQKASRELLVKLYQDRCGTTAVALADLETKVGSLTTYNSGNKWNNQYCVHLQQPNNKLGAEINIAARAAVIRSDSKGALITDVKALIDCDGFGEPSRQSDPFIGDNVNKLARENRFLTLENPVGLYMTSLDTKGWKTPDGTDAQSFWKVLKGKADKVPGKSMIVRAEYAVPAALGYTVSDIKISGIPIEFGGQIAEHLEMRLGALYGPKDTSLKGGKLAPPTPLVCP